MAKEINPLLKVLRDAKLVLTGVRTYTTVRKDGLLRVKMYGIAWSQFTPAYRKSVLSTLAANGWRAHEAGVKVVDGIRSVTVFASKV